MISHTGWFTFAGFSLAALLPNVPLFAQHDIVGEWDNRFDEDFLERLPGPDIGDYLGIPLNEAARLHADSWDASLLTLPEYQCKPHPSDYGIRGPAQMREHGVEGELVVVTDGEKAILFIQAIEDQAAQCPDLAIVDSSLPKKPGREVLERMRLSERCRPM